jgi:hypothetical protein
MTSQKEMNEILLVKSIYILLWKLFINKAIKPVSPACNVLQAQAL